MAIPAIGGFNQGQDVRPQASRIPEDREKRPPETRRNERTEERQRPEQTEDQQRPEQTDRDNRPPDRSSERSSERSTERSSERFPERPNAENFSARLDQRLEQAGIDEEQREQVAEELRKTFDKVESGETDSDRPTFRELLREILDRNNVDRTQFQGPTVLDAEA